LNENDSNIKVRQTTWVSLYANLALSALKLIGGLVGNSQAVVSDAIHSLTDLSTDIAILIGVRYWSKPADVTHHYGHYRLETIVTLSIGILLGGIATGILWSSVITLHEGHSIQPGWIALGVTIVSIVSKEILHRWTLDIGKSIKSAALLANAWHQRSDVLSSIPVAVAVAGAAIAPSWAFLDNIGAFAVSVCIYQAAFKIAKPAFNNLTDLAVSKEELQKITNIAAETEGVLETHEIRTRYIGCNNLAVDLHILVDGNMSVFEGHDISEMVKERLLKNCSEVVDVVVHIEPREDYE